MAVSMSTPQGAQQPTARHPGGMGPDLLVAGWGACLRVCPGGCKEGHVPVGPWYQKGEPLWQARPHPTMAPTWLHLAHVATAPQILKTANCTPCGVPGAPPLPLVATLACATSAARRPAAMAALARPSPPPVPSAQPWRWRRQRAPPVAHTGSGPCLQWLAKAQWSELSRPASWDPHWQRAAAQLVMTPPLRLLTMWP